MDNPFKARLEAVTKRNKDIGVPVGKNPNAWPIEKKMEVVSQWLILGNLRHVAAVTEMSYPLVRKWKGEAWWPELEAEIRQSQGITLDVKLSEIAEKSLAATLDRVENGDFIYDQKSGEIKRKPAALRDVHRVAVDVLDRRENLRNGINNRGEQSKISVEEHLKMLSQQMAQMAEAVGGKKKPLVIDAEDVTPKGENNAFSEEWEEGLQAGAGMGEDEATGESEGTSGEELGSLDDDEGREGS